MSDDSVDPLDTKHDPLVDEVGGANEIAETIDPGTTKIEKEGTQDQKLEKAPSVKSSQPLLWTEWKLLLVQFTKVLLFIFILWLGALSVYWGSLYKREDRVANMKMLVVIADDDFTLANSTSVQPVLGPQFLLMLEAHPALGKFEIANVTEFTQAAGANNRTVYAELSHRVYIQDYWIGFYVNGTASEVAYSLLSNSLSTAATEISYVVNAVYQSGSHYSALSQYVLKSLRALQISWVSTYAPQAYADMITNYLTSDERLDLVLAANSTTSAAPFSNYPVVSLVDMRPAKTPVVLGPSELGLIYAQMFSLYQFNFSVNIHNILQDKLHFRHFLWFRILLSQLNYVALALVYALMTIAFQVPTDVAFGKSGFLVLWVTVYLFVSASGGLNEFASTLIFWVDKKQYLAPWVIGLIVLNIAPTFAPFVLSPGFYRYGYAVPMFNAYEALKVVFFDTWKGTLGRNYAVLVAWIIFANIILCCLLIHISRKKKEMAAKAAVAKEKNDPT